VLWRSAAVGCCVARQPWDAVAMDHPVSLREPSAHERQDRRQQLFDAARAATGFMPDDEGEALYLGALRAGASFEEATFLEIGAWCGKSSVYLGAAAEETDALLFSLDHHHGSEENQAGWEHHDSALIDPGTGRIDTLPHWRRTLIGAGLEASVIGVVGDSHSVSSRWSTPLAFCFIDGGHGEDPAWADYRGWAPHVREGGWLAIHDVFPDPADGGRPPFDIWTAALDSDRFVEDGECGSLRILRRI
jgi:MMP 1-O-methyltransferase